jgi:hypothetical protein
MNLNDLLRAKNIDPRSVLVLRHRPNEPKLRKVLPWLAAERPSFYNAYQQTQSPRLAEAMRKLIGTGSVASFIGHDPTKALFVGLYSISGSRPMTYEEYWQVPEYAEMRRDFEMQGWSLEKDKRTSQLWFDLARTNFYSEWSGKLVVTWPRPQRVWWRRADRNEFRVDAILEESALTSTVTDWKDMEFTRAELDVLPKPWRSALSQWRGIYYIFDASDRKGYVGSAYGAENLLRRWLTYAARGHGGNALLRQRDPSNFRFTILQRVSPDMEQAEIIALENSWKKRLHTRKPHGLNEN